MVSVGLFTNSKSGKNKIDFEMYGINRRIKKLRRVIRNNGEVYITGKTKDYLSDLENKVQQVCKDNPDVIAIDGGDGTISTVLTMIDRYWGAEDLPPVAILEGGTFNVMAKEMEIKNPFKYLENIVKTNDVDNLKIRGINMMRMRDDIGHNQLSFSVAVGFPIDLMEEFYKHKYLKFMGIDLKYAWIGLMFAKIMCSTYIAGDYYKKFDNKQKIKVTETGNSGNTQTQEEDWLGIIAQSIPSIGIPKFLIQPRTFRHAETEGMFHAVGTTLDFKTFLDYFRRVYLGDSITFTDWEGRTRKVLELDKQLKELKLESERPIRYQFNGELSFGSQPCKANEIYITADRHRKFIRDEFPKDFYS